MTATPAPPAPAEFEYTYDWFSPNIPVWRQIVDAYKPRRLLEIGSFEGRSTCWMIENCTAAAAGAVEIWCVDTWGGGIEHRQGGGKEAAMPDVERRFDANVAIARRRAPHPAAVNKLRNLSSRALAVLIASNKTGYFDFIYVDGSHEAPDVLADAVMSFQLLRVGGMLVFDDYLWSMDPPGTQDVLRMPKPAIDAFINIFQRKMTVISGVPLAQLYAIKIAA